MPSAKPHPIGCEPPQEALSKSASTDWLKQPSFCKTLLAPEGPQKRQEQLKH